MEEDTFAIVWHGYSRVDCECRRLGHDDCQIIDQFKVTWLERVSSRRDEAGKNSWGRESFGGGPMAPSSFFRFSLFLSFDQFAPFSPPFSFFSASSIRPRLADPCRQPDYASSRVVNMIDSFRFRTTVKRGAKRRWSVFGASAALIGIGNARGWVDRDGTKRNERMWWKGWREGGPSCEMMLGWLFLARARRISCWNKGFVTEFWFCRGNWLLHIALFLSHSFRVFNLSLYRYTLHKKDVFYFRLSRYNKDSMVNILYEEREVKRIISLNFHYFFINIYICMCVWKKR